MKQKRQKHSETLFTSYLDKDEYLIWVAEPKDNRTIRARQLSCTETFVGFFTLIGSAFSMLILTVGGSNYLLIPTVGIFFACFFLLEFRIFRLTYYAITNKRLMTLRGSELSSESLTHLQKLSIGNGRANTFDLNFEPLGLVYGREQGFKQDYPIIFAGKRLEGLSESDAQTAYDLLIAERAERAEELDLLD